MSRTPVWTTLSFMAWLGLACSQESPSIEPYQPTEPREHFMVYLEEGMFAGWPANHGIWIFDYEIVVGFKIGMLKPSFTDHALDGEAPQNVLLGRSLDGGKTWTTEPLSFLVDGKEIGTPIEPVGGIDFEHPDFAMLMRRNDEVEILARYYHSQDRCKTWEGPYVLPTFDRSNVLARTNYFVDSSSQLTALMTVAKETGGEGRPLCVRTRDGGKTWELESFIGPEPYTPKGYSIMPSGTRLTSGDLFSVVRRREVDEETEVRSYWIEGYLSEDDGKSWQLLDAPTIENAGNPASVVTLADGRIVVSYGYRNYPMSIRAVISKDNGLTWSDELMLRSDGGWWDLGYPRTVVRPDGKLVTIYYFTDYWDQERYIEATIWDPDEVLEHHVIVEE